MSALPTPLRYLGALQDDDAAEGLTNAMFHDRWAHPADVAKAGAVLPLWRAVDVPAEQVECEVEGRPWVQLFEDRADGGTTT